MSPLRPTSAGPLFLIVEPQEQGTGFPDPSLFRPLLFPVPRPVIALFHSLLFPALSGVFPAQHTANRG